MGLRHLISWNFCLLGLHWCTWSTWTFKSIRIKYWKQNCILSPLTYLCLLTWKSRFTYSGEYDFKKIIWTITLSFIDGNFSKSSNVKFECIAISLTLATLYSIGQIVIDGKTTWLFVSVWVLLPISFFANFITLRINIIQKATVKMHAKALLITDMAFYF